MSPRRVTLALAAAILVGLSSSGAAMETGDKGDAELLALEEVGPDREGLRRDTWYFAGYQWITIGLLYAAPESVSGWSDEQKDDYDMSVWVDNVTHPQWDSDDWYINYVVHPYWGGAYYVRARERGYDDRQAFWYAFLLSCLYEFGAEALFEEVSIQDFFVTPIVGTWVGRRFVRIREGIRRREVELGYRTRRDRWAWTLTDPLGALNRQVNRVMGREASMLVRPYIRMQRRGALPARANTTEESAPVYGIEFTITW